jgi:hypothetical protein
MELGTKHDKIFEPRLEMESLKVENLPKHNVSEF